MVGVSQKPPSITVLAAGGAGYIGSQTAKDLSKAGIVRDAVQFGSLYEGTIADAALVRCIFGMHYPTSDGTAIRDYTHVTNLAEAPLKLLRDYGPRRERDAPALVSDPHRSVEMLGWTPQYSSLETIVGIVWNWHKRGHGATL